MPLTLTEKLDSRKWNTGDNASVEMVYVLTGTSDDLAAKTLVEDSTAETYNGLVRPVDQPGRGRHAAVQRRVEPQPEWVDTTSGDGRWIATVRYGVRPPVEVGESSFSFDTGGGTQHITQSIQTIQKYAPPGKTAPDGVPRREVMRRGPLQGRHRRHPRQRRGRRYDPARLDMVGDALHAQRPRERGRVLRPEGQVRGLLPSRSLRIFSRCA